MLKKAGAPTPQQEAARKRQDELQAKLVARQVVKPKPESGKCPTKSPPC